MSPSVMTFPARNFKFLSEGSLAKNEKLSLLRKKITARYQQVSRASFFPTEANKENRTEGSKGNKGGQDWGGVSGASVDSTRWARMDSNLDEPSFTDLTNFELVTRRANLLLKVDFVANRKTFREPHFGGAVLALLCVGKNYVAMAARRQWGRKVAPFGGNITFPCGCSE
jgi:hypothetical protein